MSAFVPRICLLFGPSAAGGAYIPAFCDIVIMNDGNASMYLGSPRMAEMVIGEKVTLEEMGGAKMHCTVSGCGGDILVNSEEERATKVASENYLGLICPANYLDSTAVLRRLTVEPNLKQIRVLRMAYTRAKKACSV